jgi:CRISPR/Cas system-associated endonuclease Cas3-HD
MEAEFLREELGKYGEDDEAYSGFVRLISENMANFQFAAAQILIMKAQAERLKRTESHLDAYRAKFAELAALAEKEQVQIRSQMLEVRSLEIDSISRKSVLLSSQQQLQQ